MFFKNSNKNSEPAASPVRVSSFITKNSTFKGKITTEDNVEISGIFLGDIETSKEVIIHEHGMVTGNIKADRVVSEGKINGSIVCNTFKGDTKSLTKDKIEAISVSIMGIFEGVIKCEELNVQESGCVKNRVQAKTVEISGKVDGSIACESLSTTMHAKVTGKLFVNQLQNNGGSIDGFIGKYQDILTENLEAIKEENKSKNPQDKQNEYKNTKDLHQESKKKDKEFA
jgi:cytoskeletal protein CcmA (bactofilin family)